MLQRKWMTPEIKYLKPPIEKTTKYDECHRIKLFQQQRLWEGRYIIYEKKKPAMMKVIMFNGVK